MTNGDPPKGVSRRTFIKGVHIYMAVRPEKLAITKSMIVGSMSREFYLEEHDPHRWVVGSSSSPKTVAGGASNGNPRAL